MLGWWHGEAPPMPTMWQSPVLDVFPEPPPLCGVSRRLGAGTAPPALGGGRVAGGRPVVSVRPERATHRPADRPGAPARVAGLATGPAGHGAGCAPRVRRDRGSR